jgi:chromosome segregation ATPase
MSPRFFTPLLLAASLCASEPSAFGAGDLESKSPYGLSETEKYIHHNKETINENKETINELKNKIIYLESSIEELKSALEGFRSLSRGGNEKLFNLGKDLNRIETDLKLQGDFQKKMDDDARALALKIETSEKNQAQINEQLIGQDENLKTAIKELSSLIDSINSTYVQKDELKSALDKLIAQINEQKEVKKETEPDYSKINASDLFNQAKDDFKERKLTAARKALEFWPKRENTSRRK